MTARSSRGAAARRLRLCRAAPTPAGTILLLAGTLIVLGCDDSGGGTEPGAGIPMTVEVSPAELRVERLGEEIEFEATVRDAEGREVEPRALEWDADAPSVLESLGNGSFLTVGQGTASVVAMLPPEQGVGGPSGTARVEVEQLMAALRVEPRDDTLRAPGQQVRFEAVPLDASGTPLENGAPPAEWTVEDDEVARVEADGTLIARSDGRTVVTAEMEGISDSASVSVEATFPVRACRVDPDGGDPQGEDACDERTVTVREEDR